MTPNILKQKLKKVFFLIKYKKPLELKFYKIEQKEYYSSTEFKYVTDNKVFRKKYDIYYQRKYLVDPNLHTKNMIVKSSKIILGNFLKTLSSHVIWEVQLVPKGIIISALTKNNPVDTAIKKF